MIIKSGIYCIKNLITKKSYVGSSIDVYNRIMSHKNMLKKNKHHSIKLQNAYNKYGKHIFLFEILEFCHENKLLTKEKFYIDKLNSYEKGYNCAKHPSRPTTCKIINIGNTRPKKSVSKKTEKYNFNGKKVTEEHIKKMIETHKAKKNKTNKKTVSKKKTIKNKKLKKTQNGK